MSRHVSCSTDSPEVLLDLAHLVKAAKQRPLVIFGPLTVRESFFQLLLGAYNPLMATQPLLTPAAADSSTAAGHSTAVVVLDTTAGMSPP